MTRTHPTIAEVARRAGVSPATVSRVLNGTARVSQEKVRAVLRAIEELGYTPSPLAQSLAKGRSYAVGILLPDFGSPFYGPILEAITLELEPTPFRPIAVPGHWSLVRELEALDFLKGHRVEAIVLLGTSLEASALEPLGVPILAFGQRLLGPRTWSLVLNNREAAYRATRYLLEKGHRHIAHISSHRGGMDVRERLLGYRKAMREMGLAPRVVYGNLQEDGGYEAARELLARFPDTTAIFAANDQTAIGARLYLFERGLAVPEDLSLVGFDDIPLAAYQVPPLTTVRQPAREVGRALAQALKDLLQGETPSLSPIPLQLVERGSVKEVRA
ncbi:LacI family transcriptional regulator [Thermus sp. 2.9]|uniref:LacI family DNA-binding transcriptional regulator n=1 Tax=Thermus sp. (strain 2.9) TaxID=1577051 RepID=UPI0005426729|nr:LacI family DNA-binding transcriptional regulator [Thermus sp. 2.9]KHG64436.1 LacI family transcriptional regulator [Thermus sp. 2.9]